MNRISLCHNSIDVDNSTFQYEIAKISAPAKLLVMLASDRGNHPGKKEDAKTTQEMGVKGVLTLFG